MGDKERFKIKREVDTNPLAPQGTTVTVEDTKTGNKVSSWDLDKEKAEKKAWEKLEKVQGPPPSKSGG